MGMLAVTLYHHLTFNISLPPMTNQALLRVSRSKARMALIAIMYFPKILGFPLHFSYIGVRFILCNKSGQTLFIEG